jgi:hypothetical protein
MANRKPRRSPPPIDRALLEHHPSGTLPMVGAEEVRQRIVGGLFPRDFVSDALGGAVCPYRERLLTIEVVVLCMLEFVLERMPSFLAIVDRLGSGKIAGVGSMSVSPQAFYRRLQRLPHQMFLATLERTSQQLRRSQRFSRPWVRQLAGFADGLYAVDDTTLDALVRRTQLLRQYPKGAMETLGGRLGCAIDLTTGGLAQVVYDPDAAANEKSHVRQLIAALPERSLLVFDLGYFSFGLFDWITEGGRFFVTRMRERTSFTVLQVLANRPAYRDRVVWLGKYRADRAAHPVRLVEIFVDGKWLGYITNVLEPSRIDAKQLWSLYCMRWTIEMAFATIKRALGMAFLRPTGKNAMLIQIWSTLIVYQLLQDVRLELAATLKWREDEISWEMLMRRVAWYAEQSPAVPLAQWLVSRAESLNLKKRGVRQRRRTELPHQVLSDLLPIPPDPDPDALPSRTSRQGDPHPLKKDHEILLVQL